MSALRAMRLTLAGSIALFGLGLLLSGSGRGILTMIFATMAMAVSALGCVILQLAQLFSGRRRNAAEKSE